MSQPDRNDAPNDNGPNDSMPSDIRGVLIQIAGGRLLLPNATVSEVLSFAPPEPLEGAPDWILGSIRWRGWQLPLVAWARLSGSAPEEAGDLGSKALGSQGNSHGGDEGIDVGGGDLGIVDAVIGPGVHDDGDELADVFGGHAISRGRTITHSSTGSSR